MSEAFIFPSKEWAGKFCKVLNESVEYRNAAKTWEGAILFVCTNLPDNIKQLYDGRDKVGFALDLYHGECRGVTWTLNPETLNTPYVIEATYDDWVKILTGKLGPVPAMMSRKLRVTKGSLATILRYATASIAMVKAAQKVPTKLK